MNVKKLEAEIASCRFFFEEGFEQQRHSASGFDYMGLSGGEVTGHE